MIYRGRLHTVEDYEPYIGAEAVWKGTPVIGGNTGGIRYQIDHGRNGYLVSSVKEAAEAIVRPVKDRKLRDKMGRRAREKGRRHFLMTRYLEEYLNLFNSFDTMIRLKRKNRISMSF